MLKLPSRKIQFVTRRQQPDPWFNCGATSIERCQIAVCPGWELAWPARILRLYRHRTGMTLGGVHSGKN